MLTGTDPVHTVSEAGALQVNFTIKVANVDGTCAMAEDAGRRLVSRPHRRDQFDHSGLAGPMTNRFLAQEPEDALASPRAMRSTAITTVRFTAFTPEPPTRSLPTATRNYFRTAPTSASSPV